MTLTEYLQEDGRGGFANYLVRDLVPREGVPTEWLLLVESPHTDELRTGTPLAGGAGQAARNVLTPTGAPPEALGPFVAGRHRLGDYGVAILNVSRVPLQLAAFSHHRSRQEVAHLDWHLLKRVRTNDKDHIDDIADQQVVETSRLLLPSLQLRVSQLDFATRAVVVPAGKFALRHWNSLANQPKVATLPIPHPSNGWWTRATSRQDLDNLAEITRLFEMQSPSPL